MRKSVTKNWIVFIVLFTLVINVFCVEGIRSFSKVNGKELGDVYNAVESLRQGDGYWSVGSFDGNSITNLANSEDVTYTYYTLQKHQGKAYKLNSSMAFVPNKIVHSIALDCYGPNEDMVNSEKYSVVLVNDSNSKMTLIFTASNKGTIYFQDLAQVPPLHFDERENVGVYGEYRIVKLNSNGETVQLFPASGNHELYASNGAPTTSAWVNSSVSVEEGDKILFVSEKPNSTIFSSPSISYSKFEEVYEFKNFWKWQQINDANYFEVGYRNTNGVWQSFPNLETKKGEYDIYPRRQAAYQAPLYWSFENPYMLAFGGMWVHASSDVNSNGIGAVGYVFKVPHSGYVNVSLDIIGHYQSEVEVWHNDTKLYTTTEADRVQIFHYGFNYSKDILPVKAGDLIYFIQTATLGPSPQDLNPKITYLENPYTLSESSVNLSEGDEKDLTLSINSSFGLENETIEWKVEPEGIVKIEGDGTNVKLTTEKVGEAVVSAKIGEFEPVTCNVVVESVNKFSVSTENIEIKTGENGEVVVTILNERISLEDIRVSVEDDSIATALKNGNKVIVTGVSVGSTELYIQAEGSRSIIIQVNVTKSEEKPIDNPDDNPKDNGDTQKEKKGCKSILDISVFALIVASLLGIYTIQKRRLNNYVK